MVDTSHLAPGVYISEVPATGPIQGVGTSVVAFVGPTSMGPINTPIAITNWTQFKTLFGDYPTPSNAFYTPYAVRGFFGNGGTIAYIVRVSAAVRAFLNLSDRVAVGTAPTALVVRAQKEGSAGNSIQVAVQDASIVPATQNVTVVKARAPIDSAAGTSIKLQNPSDAAQFRTGDTITIDPATGSSTERAPIVQIQGTQITLGSSLTTSYTNTAFVRIADLPVNQAQTTFRIQNYKGIETGSAIQLSQGTTQENHVVDSLSNDFLTITGTELTNTFSLGQNAAPIVLSTFEFTLVVSLPTAHPAITETFNNLAMDPRHSRYFGTVVNSQLVNIVLPDTPDVQPPPINRPAVLAATNLTNGQDENARAIGPNQYTAALTALERVGGVNLVCAPASLDATTQASVQEAIVAHCQNMTDRFAILDASQGSTLAGTGATSVLTQVGFTSSPSGYAAFYYPWIRISDPTDITGKATLLVPPSGHIAGIYARSDSQRGVHKAPANEFINGALDLEVPLNDTDQGRVNTSGVNVLRFFPGQRPIVWGAHTTSQQTAWQYINVRRLFIFVEQSLIAGLRWAVFEPNDTTLWKKLERMISEFLTRVWASGALFGVKASDAFYVKIDEELNTPDTRALGQVIIEVGIAPVRPAEFVVVQIAMWEGGAQSSTN